MEKANSTDVTIRLLTDHELDQFAGGNTISTVANTAATVVGATASLVGGLVSGYLRSVADYEHHLA